VLIGLGTPDQAASFCAGRLVHFSCVTSPDRSAHRAYGLRRGTVNQVTGPRVWGPWLRNQVKGLHQGGFGQGDVAQLSGTFVVDAGGVVRFAYRGQRSSDNPPNDEVVAAVALAARERL
jgi:alkyl-hydroperoxide reductase/thiol specific antioxidant family protein